MRSLAWAFLALTVGCAYAVPTKKSSLLTKECKYGTDQGGTFLGDWGLHAVPVLFAAGNFSAEEKATILEGIAIWNEFYGSSKGYPVFDGQGGQEAAISSPPSNICASHAIIQSGRFTDSVILYKRSSGWIYGSGAIGVTTTCPDANGTFYNSQIEINFQDYFVAGKRVPDLKSILVHEFGHLAGLDHSCEQSPTRQGVPSCQAGNLPADYFDAVMYPVVNFTGNSGVPKFKLNKNDQGRANCLKWD